MDNIPVPVITDDLIKYLSMVYPRQYARPSSSLPDVYFQGGQQSVIEHLKDLKDQQDEDMSILAHKVIKHV